MCIVLEFNKKANYMILFFLSAFLKHLHTKSDIKDEIAALLGCNFKVHRQLGPNGLKNTFHLIMDVECSRDYIIGYL